MMRELVLPTKSLRTEARVFSKKFNSQAPGLIPLFREDNILVVKFQVPFVKQSAESFFWAISAMCFLDFPRFFLYHFSLIRKLVKWVAQ